MRIVTDQWLVVEYFLSSWDRNGAKTSSGWEFSN
jgi:hypothetical protein